MCKWWNEDVDVNAFSSGRKLEKVLSEMIY